jgi:hypothetical protein
MIIPFFLLGWAEMISSLVKFSIKKLIRLRKKSRHGGACPQCFA